MVAVAVAVAERAPETLAVSLEERQRIVDFLTYEARLADESQYAEWESLVDDDMIYWVPRGEGNFDMNTQMSIICDNRQRLHTRIAQLLTGDRHAQVPVSMLRRVIANFEIEKTAENEYRVFSNFVLYELRRTSNNNMVLWPGRTEHRLRLKDGQFKIFFKKIMLLHGDEGVSSLAFII